MSTSFGKNIISAIAVSYLASGEALKSNYIHERHLQEKEICEEILFLYKIDFLAIRTGDEQADHLMCTNQNFWQAYASILHFRRTYGSNLFEAGKFNPRKLSILRSAEANL